MSRPCYSWIDLAIFVLVLVMLVPLVVKTVLVVVESLP